MSKSGLPKKLQKFGIQHYRLLTIEQMGNHHHGAARINNDMITKGMKTMILYIPDIEDGNARREFDELGNSFIQLSTPMMVQSPEHVFVLVRENSIPDQTSINHLRRILNNEIRVYEFYHNFSKVLTKLAHFTSRSRGFRETAHCYEFRYVEIDASRLQFLRPMLPYTPAGKWLISRPMF